MPPAVIEERIIFIRAKNFAVFTTGITFAVSAMIAGHLRADPKPLGIFSGVQPTTGPAVVDGLLTDQQRRDKIQAIWDQQEGIDPNAPHPRWEDRKGTIVAIPAPTTGPAVVDPVLLPTLVSVHLKDIPARRALTEFAKQTGIKLSMYPAQMWRGRAFPSITLDADNQPLMEVVNELACKCGLSPSAVQNYGGGPAIDPAHPRVLMGLQTDDRAIGPWEVSGPFAYEVQQVTHSIYIGNDQGGNSPVQLLIAEQHEPKLVVLARDYAPTIVEAVDEKGNNLVSANGGMQMPVRKTGMWGELFSSSKKSGGGSVQQLQVVNWGSVGQQMSVALNVPENAGRTIVRFRATNRYLIQTKFETLEASFATGTDAVEKEIAGVKCKVGPLNVQSPQQFTCAIEFRRGSKSEAEWNALAAALSGIKPMMFDEQDKPIGNMQNQGNNRQGDVVTLNFYWYVQQYGNNAPSTKPVKLVVNVPTEFKVVEVPIQFDNLPLP